jgi:hypothetical protein
LSDILWWLWKRKGRRKDDCNREKMKEGRERMQVRQPAFQSPPWIKAPWAYKNVVGWTQGFSMGGVGMVPYYCCKRGCLERLSIDSNGRMSSMGIIVLKPQKPTLYTAYGTIGRPPQSTMQNKATAKEFVTTECSQDNKRALSHVLAPGNHAFSWSYLIFFGRWEAKKEVLVTHALWCVNMGHVNVLLLENKNNK